MDLRSIISAPKESIKTGEWRRGEIPRVQWPSKRAKAKAYKYGPLYQWRIVTFACSGHDCRVRLLLNEDKQIFRASLGVVVSGETISICDYEWHASEPGWHCHARCDEFRHLSASFNRFGGQRIPKANSHHRRVEFRFKRDVLSAANAFNCAVDIFGLDKGGGIV
ncbi:hypothetical protein [Aureimonas phyllosphaerae]|uniref:Uncharacterized protein n=1 Tax=Aureimonas phyllosphaerae TaxID=1166078 RepID=A0A7W6FVX2_9HYPH|nr:hypothetical protein [Aureimonas phyllosphaerae]MBB3937724.1 hypothetical protein [Aureimonas phyllosphaerae]MBB3961741.1 hypothetical protein [Aureimonas phyllosphaerae]